MASCQSSHSQSRSRPASRWSQGSTSAYSRSRMVYQSRSTGVSASADVAGGDPAVVGEVLAPAVEPAAVAPHRLDDPADPAVAAGQQSFDDARAAVVVAEADRPAVPLVGAHVVAQLLQPRVGGLPVELGRPLERRVRLGHEPADRDRAADVVAAGDLAALGDDLLRQVGDLQDVLVGLGGQPAHEVELHLPPAVGVRRRDGPDQVLLGDHLVDHLAHPLRAALGGERQPGAAAVAGELVGQRDVEGVDPGRRQRQRDVGALVAVGEPLGDLADLAVVGAGQRQQPDLLEAGLADAVLDHVADGA